jgi:sulfatase modifying factor 1
VRAECRLVVRRLAWQVCLIALACLVGCRREPAGRAGAKPPVVTTKGGVRMVLLPGGRFTMGGARRDQVDETPHEVSVGAFYIDVHEVTQAEYRKVMGKNPARWKGGRNPVEQIRWSDAAKYCNARSRRDGLECAYDLRTWRCDFRASGYRLPTEAEWEYAARAGTKGDYSFGDDPAQLGRYAWFRRNKTRGTHPVGTKSPNGWGLHDMYGNVWEWCSDFYDEQYYRRSPADDPTGPAKGKTRVLRGGGWNSARDECRSSYRYDEDPGYADVCFGKDVHGFYGFRCVRRP